MQYCQNSTYYTIVLYIVKTEIQPYYVPYNTIVLYIVKTEIQPYYVQFHLGQQSISYESRNLSLSIIYA